MVPTPKNNSKEAEILKDEIEIFVLFRIIF